MSPPSRAERDLPRLALIVIDRIPAMIAYWDRDEICRFANQAYQRWFGKSREQLIGTRLCDLLGPIYALNRPYIQAALAGEEQTFERQIPAPNGSGMRDSIATYTPDVQNGAVSGFFVHVADVTTLKAHASPGVVHARSVSQVRRTTLPRARAQRGRLSTPMKPPRPRPAT